MAPQTDPDSGGSLGSSGRAAADATSRTGQGSKRKDLRQQARERVEGGSLQGDRVLGDKIVVNAFGQTRLTLHRFGVGEVDKVRETFQEPPGWETLRVDAWRRRSVVVRGPDGAGKTAASVRLLLSAVTRAWYVVNSVADLARLSDVKDLGEGAGLMLLHPGDLDQLRGSQLEAMEGMLEEADARLVVVADDSAVLGAGVGEFVQRLRRPENLAPIVQAHLSRQIGEAAAELSLDVPGIADLIDDLLEQGTPCREAVRLAEILAAEQDWGGLDPERVRARMTQRVGQEPEEWFEGVRGPEVRTQALALAVLNGLPQEDVTWAAVRLLDRFAPENVLLTHPAAQARPPRMDLFGESRRATLERLQARSAHGMTRGQYGWVPCTVVEFRDAAFPPRLIRHAWNEYQIQGQLISWLAELVDSSSDQVRSFAGTALGLIAVESFDHLATQVFPRWIVHKDRGTQRREAVAYALSVCMEDDRLAAGVRSLVDGWYLGDAWQGQAAAARAYGLCPELTDIRGACDALRRLGAVDRMGVAIAIGDSFADLLEADLQGNATVVMEALTGMVAQGVSRLSGHLAFLIIADALVTEQGDAARGVRARSQPSLLLLADQRPDLREQLAYLWCQVVSGEMFAEEAGGVLQRWAGQAESDPLLLDILMRMLRDLAGRDPRVRAQLLRYAHLWTAPEARRPLDRAARLLKTQI